MAKKKSRRDFIEFGIKAGIVFPFLSTGIASCKPNSDTTSTSENKSSKKLNILILGGTSFLGPHQIAYALGRGHSISMFTRGKTKPTIYKDLFDNVEQLVGDRNDDLTALQNRKWDAVIDNSGHKAKWTKDSATLLKDNCDLYLYTSSTGVFYPYLGNDIKEDTDLVLTEPQIMNEVQKLEYGYGVMKANSELEAIKQFGKERTIIVRPTYMIGPADKTNRFIHWPIRLDRGGEVMVPGKSDDMVQYIDVRDTAEWMIRLIEDKNTGTYNAAGPKEPQSIYSFVEEASSAFESKSTFVKIDNHDFLQQNEVFDIVPWIMPVGDNFGSAKINNQKAIANGLTIRPLTLTVKETFDWWNSNAVSQKQRDEVTSNPKSILVREDDILKKWKALKAG